jgi:hypothetical protein
VWQEVAIAWGSSLQVWRFEELCLVKNAGARTRSDLELQFKKEFASASGPPTCLHRNFVPLWRNWSGKSASSSPCGVRRDL